MKEGCYYCAKCKVVMNPGFLSRYEYEEGIPLHHVSTLICSKCGKYFFTEEQAHAMRDRTREIKEYTFGFERKVTISGKSLVVGIPSELANHLHIKKGQKVRIIPVASEGILIKKA